MSVKVSNRRAYFRVETKIDAVLRVNNVMQNVQVVDISTGGLQITSKIELPLNEFVTIYYSLPSNRMTAYCRIVRNVKSGDPEYQYGCKYEYISENDRKKIYSYLFDTQALSRWL